MATQVSFTREDMQSLHNKLKTWSDSLSSGERKALGMILFGAAKNAKQGDEVSGYEWADTGLIDLSPDTQGFYRDEIYRWWTDGGLPTELVADVRGGRIIDTFDGRNVGI